jgi:hypothetical protein
MTTREMAAGTRGGRRQDGPIHSRQMHLDADQALAEILSSTRVLLLDFDGPICDVFAGYPAADITQHLRDLLANEHEQQLPPTSSTRSIRCTSCAARRTSLPSSAARSTLFFAPRK